MSTKGSVRQDACGGLLAFVLATVPCLHGPVGHAAGAQGPWKPIPDTSEALGLAADPAGKRIWFISQDRLGRIDTESGKVTFVADGSQHGGLCMHKLVLDGGCLWVAGFKTGKSGSKGGLARYDIATGALTVYRVNSTMEGSAYGLESNDVSGLTVWRGELWLNGVGIDQCWGGLTRLRPDEARHAARWTTFTAESTGGAQGAGAGLACELIDAAVPSGGQLLLFFAARPFFQEFDPQKGSFRTLPLLEKDPNVTDPQGRSRKVAWMTGEYRFAALEGGGIWFMAAVWGPQEWTGERPVKDHPGPYRIDALFRYDRDSRKYTILSPGSTESRPGAGDGLPSLAHRGIPGNIIYRGAEYTLWRPVSVCVDGPQLWIVVHGTDHAPGGIVCYDRTSASFLQYPIRNGNAIVATRDSIWAATAQGVLRLRKSGQRAPAAPGGK